MIRENFYIIKNGALQATIRPIDMKLIGQDMSVVIPNKAIFNNAKIYFSEQMNKIIYGLHI